MGTNYKFEWNWKKRLKDWTWYAAGLAIIGPFILVVLIDPDWLARLIGIVYFTFGIPAILFWYAFGPKRNLGSEGRTIWPDYILKRFGDKVFVGTRILLLGLAITSLYLMTIPLAKDIVVVVGSGQPLKQTQLVTQTRCNSMTGWILQHVTLSENNVINTEYSAFYFPPRQIMQQNTYQFLYLPNSRIILDAESVSPTGQ